ncbi:MAG: hypothetical protein AB7P14_10660 [Blastocatellales bacterium]
MFDEIIRLVREAALTGRVYLVIHANRELKADGFVYDDVNCLLTGEIVEQ